MQYKVKLRVFLKIEKVRLKKLGGGWITCREGIVFAPEVGDYLVYIVTAMKGTKHFLVLKNNLLSMLTSRALVIHVDIPWCD